MRRGMSRHGWRRLSDQGRLERPLRTDQPSPLVDNALRRRAASRSARIVALSARTRPPGMARLPARSCASAADFVGAGDHPQDVSRTIDDRIRQRHPAPALIRARYGNVCIGHVEHRIAGHQRRGVAIGAEPEVHQVEHRRRAAQGTQRRGIAPRRGRCIGGFYGHCVQCGPAPTASSRAAFREGA